MTAEQFVFWLWGFLEASHTEAISSENLRKTLLNVCEPICGALIELEIERASK